MIVLLVYRPEAAVDAERSHGRFPFDGIEIFGVYDDEASANKIIDKNTGEGWKWHIESITLAIEQELAEWRKLDGLQVGESPDPQVVKFAMDELVETATIAEQKLQNVREIASEAKSGELRKALKLIVEIIGKPTDEN